MAPMTSPSADVDVTLVQAGPLREVTTAVLREAGLDDTAAAHAADALVAADLRGVDSHGVSNMLRLYVRWLADGTMNAAPDLRIVREAAATMVYDCDGALGIAVAPTIMAEVIARARRYGIAFATAINGRHLGMLAHPAMLALPHDMIGMSSTSGGPRMVPTGGREARLGTNPVAIAVPAGRRAPFVYDAASTVLPVNKLRHATRWETPLPIGVFLEEDGTQIAAPRVPRVADADHLAPLGSRPETGSHKGYGMAASVDLLCSVLSGAAFGYRAGHDRFNHFFAALDVAAFNDVDDFKAEVDDFLDMLNATPVADGVDRVVYAGQREAETAERRGAEGIPLHPEVVGWFRDHCADRGIDTSALW